MASTGLQETLKYLGLAQKVFTQHMGVSEVTVSRWSNGATPIPRGVGHYVNLLEKLRMLSELKS
jgi:DNA-binding transcriptional regulator YiaG